MTESELLAVIDANLGEYANESGSVLYSGLETIKKNDFYLMGMNPNGLPQQGSDEAINAPGRAHSHWSAYTQECWKGCSEPCSYQDPDTKLISESHRNQHQKYVCSIFDAMGVDPTSVPSANAIFAQSKTQGLIPKIHDGLTTRDWLKICWPVHQFLLAKIRPRWIVALGWSPFNWLREVGINPTTTTEQGQGWDYRKYFEATLALGEQDMWRTKILGVYHPAARQGEGKAPGPARVGQELRVFIETNLRA